MGDERARLQTLQSLFSDPDHTRKRVTLEDGRILSYSEIGNRGDIPVIFHVGLMGSSMVSVLFDEPIRTLALGLRIFAIDYPGIGESSPKPNRTLRDWPDDLSEFVDQILDPHETFALWAHSLGGPHALAVLNHHRLSKRISHATIVSPWLPFEDSAVAKTTRYLPKFIHQRVIPSLATTFSTSTLSVAGSVTSCDTNLHLQVAKTITSYASQQGQAGNHQMVQIALQETLLIPSHFVNPISIFVGTNDSLVSEKDCLELVRLLSQNGCSQVRFHIIEGADHNKVMGGDHLVRILQTLTSPSKREEEGG